MCGGDLSLRVAVGPYRHRSPLYSVLHSQTLLFFLLFLRTADPTRETEQTSLTDNISSWASWKHFTNHPVGQQKAAGLHSLTHSSWRYFSTVSAL